jgi:oligogalacturonide transport system permease protein
MSRNRKRTLTNKKRNAITGVLFILPWIIGFGVFVIYPLIRSVYFSFNNVKYSGKLGYIYEWVGLENYKRILFEEFDFVVEIQNFVIQILLYVPVIIALSIIIAILLNNKLKGTTFFRLIFFLPIIILNGKLMENMSNYGGMSLNADGLMISVISKITPDGLFSTIILLFTTILEILWYCGVPILIFLSALQKIDNSIREAAQIDGASPWDFFWKITLPTIYPLVSVTIVFVVVFLANFDNNPINQIIMESRYNASRREGYASALAILYAFIQTILIAFLFLITRKSEKGGRA